MSDVWRGGLKYADERTLAQSRKAGKAQSATASLKNFLCAFARLSFAPLREKIFRPNSTDMTRHTCTILSSALSIMITLIVVANDAPVQNDWTEPFPAFRI